MGLECREEVPIKVFYDSIQVGDYRADIFVNNQVIIENKAAEGLVEEHKLSIDKLFKGYQYRGCTSFEFWKETSIQKKDIYKR